jgi:uncharacterized phage protein (TIGR01671 family)
MRELKFRIWDKLAQRFIYPDDKGQQHYVLSLKGEFTNLQNGVGGDEVVVQQGTGLRDIQAKEVYEGDIVFAPANSSKYVVQFGKYFTYDHRDEEDDHYGFYLNRMNHFLAESIGDGKSIEVIGNIFQNKELLNG